MNWNSKLNLKEKIGKGKRNARTDEAERMQAHYVPRQLRGEKLSLKKPQQLILALSAVAVVAAVLIVVFAVNYGSNYTTKEKGYQCYGGNTAEIASGTRLERNGDGQTFFVEGEERTETFLPIYSVKRSAMLLPDDWLLFTPRDGGINRVAYFSEVLCDQYGAITVSKNGKSVKPQQGFLYDGENFYIFLEPVMIEFNGYSMELPALSYAEAVYGGYMMVYNYETKEFFIEMSDGTGTARVPSGDYEISLMGDSMTLYDGSKKLLATRPDLFDPIV